MPAAACIKLYYYPFGMIQPGRKYSVDSYRYGFNGKENDNEVKGEGNQQDYGMRIYDPRLGKFLSVDPISKDYPELTPYQFASNRPIQGIDIDGLELWIVMPGGVTGLGPPIVICIGCGIKESADNMMQGAAKKQMVENKEMSYHNENVPQGIQDKLDKINKIEAEGQIIKGGAQLMKVTVTTWAEVASTILPVEKLAVLGIKTILQTKRLSLVSKTYAKAGIKGDELFKHAKYYDFEKQVYEETISEGTELVQYRIRSTGAGDYYAPKGTLPGEIGLDPKDVIETYSVTINKNKKIDVLYSTHKKNTELYYAPGSGRTSAGGGKQIYSTEIRKEGNATFKKIENPKR